MSILETPRILFRGNMSWDPIVTNNLDSFYDEAQCESELPGGAVMQPTAGTYRDRVLGFRQKAIAGGFWDVHGTHRSSFYDLAYPDETCRESLIVNSEVSGVDLGQGPQRDDGFVGVPAQFTGMLVDVEPYGATSSQLFFDTMSFGIPGGSRILARRRTRATARYVNFQRNSVGIIAGIASVLWQTSFLKEDLEIDVLGSAGLAALVEAMGAEEVLGLTVRWYTYRTIYYDTPMTSKEQIGPHQTALMNKLTLEDPYGNGVFQPNPARSKFVGSIGLWRESEPMHEPGERVLVPAGDQVIATAFSRIDGDRLTLDLGNSIPETGLDLAKQSLGELDVYAIAPGRPDQKIATLSEQDYDREAYETGSGIVSKTIDPSVVASSATLEIRSSRGTLLQEDAIRLIPIVPNIYGDQGETALGTYQVYVSGEPRGGLVKSVSIAQLDNNFNQLGTIPATAMGTGLVVFTPPTATPGVSLYVPLLPGEQFIPTDPGTFAQHHTYVNFRCLPTDDWVGKLPPTWDNVYCYVLANWNALAPCMDNWLDLYDPDQVRTYGAVLKRLTDPANFESFRYMPVTRDMTRGQRTLLYAFLDAPAADSAIRFAPQAAQAAGDDGRETILSLSRAMRSPNGGQVPSDGG
ncbi:MAG TPA: hypothetical protein VGX37_05150 [Allosphingosinicella sp.]|jgi:hypothetical protein|nr:hypothetical protein [Allosphingosinicella sp.]